MSQILQKSLLKWSAIALMGVSAYFVGYLWGVQGLEANEADEKARLMASEESQKPADLSHLKERVH